LSVTVDTNILLYATNADDEVHGPARKLVERLANGPDLLYLFWPTIMGYMRIATHPAIFANPRTPSQAAASIASLLQRPNIRAPAEEAGFLDVYRHTAGDDTRGNQVPDAHLVALMRQHGVAAIYTRDRDFRRYEGIDARDPFV
jgi:uncharacterized protein